MTKNRTCEIVRMMFHVLTVVFHGVECCDCVAAATCPDGSLLIPGTATTAPMCDTCGGVGYAGGASPTWNTGSKSWNLCIGLILFHSPLAFLAQKRKD